MVRVLTIACDLHPQELLRFPDPLDGEELLQRIDDG